MPIISCPWKVVDSTYDYKIVSQIIFCYFDATYRKLNIRFYTFTIHILATEDNAHDGWTLSDDSEFIR